MAVFCARALLELTPATLLPIGLATRSCTARAGRMSRGERVSACWERTRLSPPETPAPNAWAKRPHQSRSDWLVRL